MKKFVVVLITLLALTLSVAMADTLILPDDLTTIETEAFYGTDADTIILPTGVTTIGDQAFGGSKSLRTVYVPDNLMDREQAALGDSYPAARFVSLESLSDQFRYSIKTDSVWITGYTGTQTAVVIPSSIQGKPVTVIDSGAFRDNQTITGVVIPAGVTEIKDNVFNGCTALTDVSLPSSLTKIGNNVFSSCTGLTEIRLPDQLTKIGSEDFLGCTGLKAIHLPDHLTEIGGSAFRNCSYLTNVTFPASLTALGNNAFTGCGNSSAVPYSFVLPDNISSFGNMAADNTMAFYECNAVRIVVPGSDTARLLSTKTAPMCWFTFAGEEDFRYLYFRSETNGPYDSLHLMKYEGTSAQAIIPDHAEDKIRVIHNAAFYENETVTSVTIPEGVYEIQANSFRNCYNLTDVTFPSTLTTFGYNAFSNCGQNATEAFYFRLPDHVSVLGRDNSDTEYAFGGCNAIKVVTPGSDTAIYMSRINADRSFFTFEDQEDFLYLYDQVDGVYNSLRLTRYIGTGSTVVIPEGVATIGDAFSNNMTITRVDIPEGVTLIKSEAFNGCKNLTDVRFPSTLKQIETRAFNEAGSNSEAIYYYVLPDNVEYIPKDGRDAFPGCKARLCCNRYVGDTATETSTYQQLGNNRWWGWAEGPFRMTDYYVPYTYTSTSGELHTIQVHRIKLGGYVPEEGTDWTQPLTIPRSVYCIGDDCFKNMTMLRSLIMPDYELDEGIGISQSVQVIGERAFMGCLNLTSIQFPESAMSHISDGAFSGCGNNAALNSYTFSFSLPQTDTFILCMTDDGEHVANCNAKFDIRWIEVYPINN